MAHIVRDPYPSASRPPLIKEIWVLGSFGLSIKSWLANPPPQPPPDMGKFSFRQIWTEDQKFEVGHQPPLPKPPNHTPDIGKFGFWHMLTQETGRSSLRRHI